MSDLAVILLACAAYLVTSYAVGYGVMRFLVWWVPPQPENKFTVRVTWLLSVVQMPFFCLAAFIFMWLKGKMPTVSVRRWVDQAFVRIGL